MQELKSKAPALADRLLINPAARCLVAAALVFPQVVYLVRDKTHAAFAEVEIAIRVRQDLFLYCSNGTCHCTFTMASAQGCIIVTHALLLSAILTHPRRDVASVYHSIFSPATALLEYKLDPYSRSISILSTYIYIYI